MKYLLLLCFLFIAGFYYVYQSHPSFNHPAHWAVACIQNSRWISYFVRPSTIHKRGKDAGTLLHYAVVYNPNPEVLIWLIKQGVDVNALDQVGKSPLYYAVTNRQKFKILVKNKANVNLKMEKGNTLLHYIVSISDDIEILKLALEWGANVKGINNQGDSILHTAVAENPNTKLLEWFLKKMKKVDVMNYNNLTLLHKAAAKSRNPKIIQLLLDKGANKEARDVETQHRFTLGCWF